MIPTILCIPKPSNWSNLALYEKIGVYAQNLTKEHSKYIDKLEAKALVKEMLGERIEVAKVIRVLENWKDVKQEDFNCNHIIKSSHASGWNICIDKTTRVSNVQIQLCRWNKQYKPTEEKQYSFLTPRFFIEEKIKDSVLTDDENCIVYMFRYIHGRLISVAAGVGHNHLCNHYDNDWNLILAPEIPFDIPKPKRLYDMIQMSELLANGFEFVRIDFFIDKKDKIYFSEFTLTPKAGKPVFPLHLEEEYGKLWT